MKQVYLKSPASNYTLVDNASTEMYYGADYGGKKAFLTRTDYEGGTFLWLCKNDVNKGNAFNARGLRTLRQALTSPLTSTSSHNVPKIYEFATSDELFNWLAE